jgi:hypothetical protein
MNDIIPKNTQRISYNSKDFARKTSILPLAIGWKRLLSGSNKWNSLKVSNLDLKNNHQKCDFNF